MKKTTFTLVLCAAVLVAGFVACLGRAQSNGLTTNDMNDQTISLVKPAETGATLLQALQLRASTREYAAEGLSLEQLSGVLWAAAGENRPGDPASGRPGRLTAPSAMALYPIRTYAVLPGGIYLYDAPTHSLSRVAEGDFRRLAGLQEFVYTAPLNIVYVADLETYGDRWSSGVDRPEDAQGGMPEDDIMRLCAMDAAGYCQNANLWAAANGLGSVTRAGARGDEFLAAVGAPASYRFVLAQTVGVPAE